MSFILLIGLLCGCGNTSRVNQGRLRVVVTVFPLYDFARQICGENAEITLLISAGTEVHSFDPTPADARAVSSADLFFSIGGESEAWAERLSSTSSAETLKLMESIDLLYEDGEEEYDEHIWTAPSNAAKMIDVMTAAIVKADGENAAEYEANAAAYKQEIAVVSAEIRQLVQSTENPFILVADRFPFKYFANEYGLSYKAAFGGCAASTDVSLKVMAELVDAVKTQGVKTAFYTEMSNRTVANALSEATGVKTAELHSAHNVTDDDFKAGVTYVEIMRRNALALREGL